MFTFYLRRIIRHSNIGQCANSKKFKSYGLFNCPKILVRPVVLNHSFNSTATTAFGISTIVLGVDNADLRSQINEEESSQTTTVLPTTTETPADMSKYRLPTAAKPTTYDLYLYPDLDTGLFNGTVTVTTTIEESTTEIVMHSNQLNINRVMIDDVVGTFEIDADYELLTIRKSDASQFEKGNNYEVFVDFGGDMKDRIVGLYSSSYTNENGESRNMATSKFEPTYARQAFPCFDEPNMKATYKVHLLKPNDPSYIALSNNPEGEEEVVDGGIMVHFNETVKMSTYLTCFIVSDFTFTNNTFDNAGSEIPFRVFSSPHQLDKTNYAGEVGKKVIEYYVEYFNIPYPLPKLDMVAIPDFVSGAMEHWGLVTYRETALLYDRKTHSASNKQRILEVVAHELAHSWFGNLVTMDWWNNLWLNEGFASYIEIKGSHAAEPGWQFNEQFLTGTMHSILSLDATQSSHPIIQTVTTPDQITEVFDTVSYNKGASILRMLEDVVGDDNFRTGVTNYLNKHEFGNAVSQDLWDAIQEVVGDGLNVTRFMDTFTVQMGYPILDVTDNGDSYTLTQKRFLKDYDSARMQKSSPLNYKWNVPVRYITNSGNVSQIFWFEYDQNSITIQKPSGASWVKFNPNQVGYYRVNYDESVWTSLIDNIRDMSISDKTHLLEESFSIAVSGDLSYAIPLSLTKYLVNETEYVPWSVASSQLQAISKYMQTSEYDSDFKAYVISLLKPAYDQLTWNDDNDEDKHLENLARVVILNLACVMDYDDALNEANALFNQWINDTSFDISPNLRSIVYKFGMVTADESTWNKLFDLFDKESDANEKLKLMNGLANVRNPSLLTKLIQLAKDETYVRSQDYFTLMQYIAANPVGTPIVWDYVRENWDFLVDRFGLNERYLGRMIPSITSRFSTKIKLEEMQIFFANNPNAGAGAAARLQALETVSNNINWLQKHKNVIETWLQQWKTENNN